MCWLSTVGDEAVPGQVRDLEDTVLVVPIAFGPMLGGGGMSLMPAAEPSQLELTSDDPDDLAEAEGHDGQVVAAHAEVGRAQDHAGDHRDARPPAAAPAGTASARAARSRTPTV